MQGRLNLKAVMLQVYGSGFWNFRINPASSDPRFGRSDFALKQNTAAVSGA